jgi:hypothetical protein
LTHRFCPGYSTTPFKHLVGEYPGEEIYPPKDFRTEWGPIFHRGRLNGTARVLVLGQDPAAHESISRRILVGEAGQRVQGLLSRIGITKRYVMINTFLYSVYGSGGSRQAKNTDIISYRNSWLDALLVDTDVTAVIALGTLANDAYTRWATTQPAAAAALHLAAIKHPTYPESASSSGSTTLAKATALLLADWTAHLADLGAHVAPEAPASLAPYGTTWQDGDLAPIPEADLPAGVPAWWRDLAAWAGRTGTTTQLKRATITVTVPTAARTWPPLP